MIPADLERVWKAVKEKADIERGSIKRTIWYGGRTETIKGAGNVFKALPNIAIATMGKGKGMRKVIRNAPKNLIQLIGKLSGDTLAFAFPHAAVIAPAGEYFAQVGKSMTTTFAEIFTWILTKDAIKISHNNYNSVRGEKPLPPEIDEAIRKQIKRQLKQLTKDDPLLIIDRNLVKMKDANKKVAPAIKELMSILSRPEVLQEEKIKAMENALRTTSEALYYAEKVDRLVSNLQKALGELQDKIDHLEDFILQIRAELNLYIEESVDVNVDHFIVYIEKSSC